MDLIIMASGDSVRFGKNKLNVALDKEKMYEKTARIYNEAYEFEEKIIVSKYADILDYMRKKGFTPVFNDNSVLGQSYSIRLGLQKLGKKDNSAMMFAVCDQPLLKPDTIKKLILVYEKSDKSMAVLRYGKRLGNPCIFSYKWYDELCLLRGDIGGKTIIKKHPKELLCVDIDDENELIDIDRYETYLRILNK